MCIMPTPFYQIVQKKFKEILRIKKIWSKFNTQGICMESTKGVWELLVLFLQLFFESNKKFIFIKGMFNVSSIQSDLLFRQLAISAFNQSELFHLHLINYWFYICHLIICLLFVLCSFLSPSLPSFGLITYFLFFPLGFPGGSDGKESACNAGDLGSISGLGNPLEEGRPPIPVFLLGEFHGQRSLAGYSPWGHKENEVTEHKQSFLTFLNKILF